MRHIFFLSFPLSNSRVLKSLTWMQKPIGAMDEQQRRRVVLFPHPFQGHINPMLQLATILHTHSKGALSIIIVHTQFNAPDPSNYPNFTFLPISDGISSSRSQGHTQDVAAMFRLLNESCVSTFRDCLVNKILSKQDEPPVSCIIADAWMYMTQSIADELQLPRLVLRTSSALFMYFLGALPLLFEKGYLPIKESELESPLLELPPLRVKDLQSFPASKAADMYNILAIMVNQIKASSGLILNSYESLEQSELESVRNEFQVRVFPIGPFYKWAPESHSSLLEEDDSCLSWLDTQAHSSVIYISFGSAATLDEAQFVELALGIANSQQPFLWVVRPGLVARSSTSDNKDDFSELLPQKFREMMDSDSRRGCIVKWAPQRKVLAHPAVGGFWTHNGWNSTLESICAGVPMLCSPSFGDQRASARYVSEVWKVGFYLENGLEHGEIERYIRRLMVKEDNKEMEEMVIKARDLKDKAEICLREGGSSYKAVESLTHYICSM